MNMLGIIKLNAMYKCFDKIKAKIPDINTNTENGVEQVSEIETGNVPHKIIETGTDSTSINNTTSGIDEASGNDTEKIPNKGIEIGTNTEEEQNKGIDMVTNTDEDKDKNSEGEINTGNISNNSSTSEIDDASEKDIDKVPDSGIDIGTNTENEKSKNIDNIPKKVSEIVKGIETNEADKGKNHRKPKDINELNILEIDIDDEKFNGRGISLICNKKKKIFLM